MFQGSFNGVEEVSRAFHKSFMKEEVFLRVFQYFQGCFKEVSRTFQESFKDVSRKFNVCFKKDKSIFQDIFRGILKKFKWYIVHWNVIKKW